MRNLIDNAIEWAKTQNRVTNGYLRKQFDISENEATEIYAELKKSGIVGQQGYVIKKGE